MSPNISPEDKESQLPPPVGETSRLAAGTRYYNNVLGVDNQWYPIDSTAFFDSKEYPVPVVSLVKNKSNKPLVITVTVCFIIFVSLFVGIFVLVKGAEEDESSMKGTKISTDSLEYQEVFSVSKALQQSGWETKPIAYRPSTAKKPGKITSQDTAGSGQYEYVTDVPTTIKIVNLEGQPWQLGEKDFCVQAVNSKTGKPIVFQDNTMSEPVGGVCPNLKQ